MNMKISLGAAIAIMLMVAAAAFSATMIYAQNSFNEKSTDLERSREMYAKFTEVDRTIRENYGGTINETLLMDSVAQGYIKGIGDKYGMYISAEEFKRLRQNKEGEDVGIGAVTEISPDGYLLVTEVYPDSPAQVSGIIAGDLIVKINDLNLTPENGEQSLASLQGEAGTKLSLVVRRDAADIAIPELTRRIVAIPSVYSRVIPETSIGYLWIKQFNDNTADQFTRELHKVIEAGADCLIFDVRDNKGSSLKSAVRILDKLVPDGIIYSSIYKNGTIEINETSDANEINMPMVVLTNAGTSSAAELFAQDLKDYGKASTVGASTMGKGVILNRIILSDGSAIDLTIAQIATRSGVIFDEVGIKADYDVQGEGDWTKLDETTDAQLKKAIEVVMALRKAEETVQAEAVAPSVPEESAPAPEPAPAPEVTPPPAPSEPSSGPEASSGSSSGSESSQDESSSGDGSGASSNNRLDKDPEETSSASPS